MTDEEFDRRFNKLVSELIDAPAAANACMIQVDFLTEICERFLESKATSLDKLVDALYKELKELSKEVAIISTAVNRLKP